ncbi:MAG: DUF2125 domain-containing protein [Roseinatronobacter sp.]
MRLLLVVTLTAMLVLGGIWVFAAQMIERTVAAQIAGSPQLRGRVTPVTGFPLALRSTIEGPRWLARDGRTGWQAPELGIEAASFRPNRVTARFPTDQVLRIEGVDTRAGVADMTATIEAALDQTLREAALDMAAATFEPPLLVSGIDAGAFLLRQVADTGYLLEGDVTAMRLAPDVLSLIPPQALPGATLSLRTVQADLHFAQALPLRGPLPDILSVTLRSAALDWGDLQMTAKGALNRNPSGLIDGAIDLTLADWQPFHALLVAQGILPPDAAFLASMFFAGQSEPGTNRITLPVHFRDSVISLGPFALAQLPQF